MINWTKGTDVDPVDRSVDERREQEVVCINSFCLYVTQTLTATLYGIFQNLLYSCV